MADPRLANGTPLDHLLQQVVAGTAGDIGDDFFPSLVEHLGRTLGVCYAFVAQFPGAPGPRVSDRVETLAFWSRDQGILENIAYAIAGTPCATVLSGETRLYPENVADLFPAEPELEEMGAVSYLAMPLFDVKGEVMGHLGVIDDKPMVGRPSEMSVFRVFGVRTAAELERRSIDSALRQSEARLREILRSTHDAIVVVDEEGRVKLFNQASESLFKRRADEVIERSLDELLTTPFAQLKQGCFRHSAAAGGRPTSLWAPQGIHARRQRGAPFPVELTVSPSGEGEGSRFTLILRDIAEREAADRELKRLQLTASYLREELNQEFGFGDIVTRAASMRQVIENIDRVAATATTVLLTGETGVGKELMARAIHHRSPRADKPLIKINCAALPAELIESELFGHEAGAFTGAVGRRIGRFELADGGTLFLDEVGELSAAAQAKLLRALQEREFERVGGSRAICVDVRVIAATNRDLAAMVSAGQFRGDLYYRLNVFPVRIPSLRERREDIPAIARHFLDRYTKELGRPFSGIAPDTLERLQRYAWPGNVRELQNVIERAAILSDGPLLSVAEGLIHPEPLLPGLDPTQHTADEPPPASRSIRQESAIGGEDRSRTLQGVERGHIEQVLNEVGWIIEGPQGAAAILGIAPSTLRSRMKRLGIQRG